MSDEMNVQKNLFIGPTEQSPKKYALWCRDNPFSNKDEFVKFLTPKQAREMWILGIANGLVGSCWELDATDEDWKEILDDE